MPTLKARKKSKEDLAKEILKLFKGYTLKESKDSIWVALNDIDKKAFSATLS